MQAFLQNVPAGSSLEHDIEVTSNNGGGRNDNKSFVQSKTGDQSHLSASGIATDQFQQDPTVDWNKVGRIYKSNEQLESILEREMSRLKIVMDKRIAAQDIELEEKALIARGKKK